MEDIESSNNEGKTTQQLMKEISKKYNFMDTNTFISGSSNYYFLGNEFFGHFLFKKILDIRNKSGGAGTGGEQKDEINNQFESLFTIIERYNFFLLLFRAFDYHSNLNAGIFGQMFGPMGSNTLKNQIHKLFNETIRIKRKYCFN